ncbi:MAG: hypothetical protein R3F61_10535 [Myxococcota bacterium]
MWWIASALAAPPGSLAGTWVYSGGETEKAARDAAVEATAATFNFAFRPIARGKLAKVAVHDETITIDGDDESVVLVFRGGNDRESRGPSSGEPVDVRGAAVRFELVPDKTLTVTGETSDGGKKSVYTLTGPSTMKVSYEVWSGMLSEPMRWTLSYTRK